MKEPEWNKADAPMIKDGGSMLDRQKTRVAQRAEEARLRGLESTQRAAAQERALAAQRARSREQIDSVTAPTSLIARVANAASSYVSCLGMGTQDPTRLKRLMDEIEDLPSDNPLRIKLEPIIKDLLSCKSFEAGMRLHRLINS